MPSQNGCCVIRASSAQSSCKTAYIWSNKAGYDLYHPFWLSNDLDKPICNPEIDLCCPKLFVCLNYFTRIQIPNFKALLTDGIGNDKIGVSLAETKHIIHCAGVTSMTRFMPFSKLSRLWCVSSRSGLMAAYISQQGLSCLCGGQQSGGIDRKTHLACGSLFTHGDEAVGHPLNAENTRAISSPALNAGFRMFIMPLILSGVPTEEPPNFNTFTLNSWFSCKNRTLPAKMSLYWDYIKTNVSIVKGSTLPNQIFTIFWVRAPPFTK